MKYHPNTFFMPDNGYNRSNGYVLIAVMLLLAIIALFAIIVMKIASMNRLSVLREPLYARSQLPIDAVIDIVKEQLQQDAIYHQSFCEVYDFPWLDIHTNNQRNCTLSYPNHGEIVATIGNPQKDDDWLASSAPVQASWQKLSGITGAFLDITNQNLTHIPAHPITGNHVPAERVVSPAWLPHLNIAVNDLRLVDVDGDGLGDGLWFYPPQSLQGDKRYIIAARVEDLSSRLNVNTASWEILSPHTQPSTPADLSLQLLSSALTPAEHSSALDIILGRQNNTHHTRTQREHDWFARATHLQPALQAPQATGLYAIQDSLELLYHGGMNRPGAHSALIEQGYHWLQGNASEWDQFIQAKQNPLQWRQNNPRTWLTAISGAYDVPHGLPFFPIDDAEQIMLDINQASPEQNKLYKNGFARFLCGIDGIMETADDYLLPQSFLFTTGDSQHTPLNDEITQRDNPVELYAKLLSNACQDALDTDNWLTNHNNTDGCWVGNEALPILNHVYFQKSYVFKKIIDAEFIHIQGAEHNTFGSAMSYAFELYNPHHAPVKLSDLRLRVFASDIAEITSAFGFSIQHILPHNWRFYDSQGDPVLPPDHRVIIWDNGHAGSSTNQRFIHPDILNDIDIEPELTAAIANATDSNQIHMVRVTTDHNLIDQHNLLKTTASLYRLGTYNTATQRYEDGTFTDSQGTKKKGGFALCSARPSNHYMSCINVELLASWENETGEIVKTNTPEDYIPYSVIHVPYPRADIKESITPEQYFAFQRRPPEHALVPGRCIGLVQCAAVGYGPNAGMNILQCRPARAGRFIDPCDTRSILVDETDGTIYPNPVIAEGDIHEMPLNELKSRAATINDIGDFELTYRRVMDAYDSQIFALFGQRNKLKFSKEIDLRQESFWHATQNYHLQILDDGTQLFNYSSPDQYSSVYDLLQIPVIPIYWYENNTWRAKDNRHASLFKVEGTHFADEPPFFTVEKYADIGIARAIDTLLYNPVNREKWHDIFLTASQRPLDAHRLPLSSSHPMQNYKRSYAPNEIYPGEYFTTNGAKDGPPLIFPADRAYLSGQPIPPHFRLPYGDLLPLFLTCNGPTMDGFHLRDQNGDGFINLHDQDWNQDGEINRLDMDLNNDNRLTLIDLDKNNDGQITAADSDINQDGKITLADQSTAGTFATPVTFDQNKDGIGHDLNRNHTMDFMQDIDPQENFIPGTLNLNTADPFLLLNTLPFADETLRQIIAQTIVNARNELQGFMTIGQIHSRLLTALLINGYTVSESLETLSALQATSRVRSDIFALHLILHGYPKDDFRSGPVEARRILCIISRKPTGEINELLRYEY